MQESDLNQILQNREHENLEFKEAKNSFSVLGGKQRDRRCIYGYCVAIGNMLGGKLILGVKNDGTICGTTTELPHDIKTSIFNQTGQHIEIHEIETEKGRVVVIDIPSRDKGQYFTFYGVPLIRVDDRLEEIDSATLRNIVNEIHPDWSAYICTEATIEDLDRPALNKAKENYIKIQNARLSTKKDITREEIEKHIEEMKSRDDETFLKKARIITPNGGITRTALILLGKPESKYFLNPNDISLLRKYIDEKGNPTDYQHFEIPFLFAIDELMSKINNKTYRYFADESLIPTPIPTYDTWVIREALNNAIAHQDYHKQQRIIVLEIPHKITFENAGNFYDNKPIEKILENGYTPGGYRNPWLKDAMVNIGMIDAVGSGIRKMFEKQKERYFPLPTYDRSNPEKVIISLDGGIINEAYTKILINNKNFTLQRVILLDKVQKNIKISKTEADELKRLHLIEGRYPNIYLDRKLAGTTEEKKSYLKRAIDDDHIISILLKIISKEPGIQKSKIIEFASDKLSGNLNQKQKDAKIGYLLQKLKKTGKIKCLGATNSGKRYIED
ncbi:MAG: putative DNA binding domain-containing protein [candidate division SR1 bacterium]|nr:putative DNA binding domain-containing protein [candidate division SR1 bacterium]